MKTIEPIPIWDNGKSVNANVLSLNVTGGVLFQSAVFSYMLMNADADGNLKQLVQSSIMMKGEDYKNWGENDDYPYTWAASPEQLDLIITGDYVPPIPPTPEPPAPEITEPNN